MRRWAILTVVLVVLSAFFVSSYGGINVNSAVPRPGIMGQPSRSPYGDREQARSPYDQANVSTGVAPPGYPGTMSPAPAPLDPNKVYAAIKAFPGLDKQLAQVGRGSRNEVTEWLRLQESLADATAPDNRSRLSREIQKQVELELALLRKLAKEEGAKKTVAAIDGVLLYRQSRLEKLSAKMEEDRRAARARASSTRSSRGRTSRSGAYSPGYTGGRRGTSGQYRGQTGGGAMYDQNESYQEVPPRTPTGRRSR